MRTWVVSADFGPRSPPGYFMNLSPANRRGYFLYQRMTVGYVFAVYESVN